jgi:hypothetical protein
MQNLRLDLSILAAQKERSILNRMLRSFAVCLAGVKLAISRILAGVEMAIFGRHTCEVWSVFQLHTCVLRIQPFCIEVF